MKHLRSLILAITFVTCSQSFARADIRVNFDVERSILAVGTNTVNIMDVLAQGASDVSGFFIDYAIPTAGGIATGQPAFFIYPLWARVGKPAAMTAAAMVASFLLYRTVTNQILPAFLPNQKSDHASFDEFSDQAKASQAIIASSSYFSSGKEISFDDLNLEKKSKRGLLRYGLELKQAVDNGVSLPNLHVNGGDSIDFQSAMVSLAKLGSYNYKVISSEGLLNNPRKGVEVLGKLIKNAASGTFSGSKTLLIFADMENLVKVANVKDDFATKKVRRLFKQAVALRSKNFAIVGHINNPGIEMNKKHGFYSLDFSCNEDLNSELAL